ncbi:MAG: peptidyl-prolyl cis-trans isomerase [Desulfobulbaceae bacterium]|nr:peptidyl-prolyl cis-trans isomerase [Desulfobulbaceae bacterium]
MQNYFRTFVTPIWTLLLLLTLSADVRCADLQPGAAGETGSSPSSSGPVTGKMISLSFPLQSPYFGNTPVALVNDEPITVAELDAALGPLPAEQNTDHDNEAATDYLAVLERMISSRLVVLEAKNIGLDETTDIQTELKSFRLKTLLQMLVSRHLEGLQPDAADVAALYHKMSREVQLYSLTFTTGPEAEQFLKEAKDGDFDQLAERFIAEEKATGEKSEQYVKIKDLRPQIGEQVYAMEKGDISNIFRTDKGFLLFRLADTRFVEDEAVEKEAKKIVGNGFRRQKAVEYSDALTEKYVSFDEELYDSLNFDQDFSQLKSDQRVLATVNGDVPETITVADLAAKLEGQFFHGTDKAQNLNMLNKRKDIEISNILFQRTGELEARNLGIDKSEEFIKKINDFERSILFRSFMKKVVLPEVKLTPKEVKTYYDEHITEYSSPAMLRIKSLAFHELQDAENALNKLHKGADFKWVSANATGYVPPDAEGLLPFDEKLLSLTALPEDLQDKAGKAQKGDSLLYGDQEKNYYYVLVMDQIFPPKPQPYEEAKDAVAKTVFERKSQEVLEEWVGKLKEVYETKIFITGREL